MAESGSISPLWKWYDSKQIDAVRTAGHTAGTLGTLDPDDARIALQRALKRHDPASSLAEQVTRAHSLFESAPADRDAELKESQQRLDISRRQLRTADAKLKFVTSRRPSRSRWWPPNWSGSRDWTRQVVAGAVSDAQLAVDRLAAQVDLREQVVIDGEQWQRDRARWYTEHGTELIHGVAAAIELETRAAHLLHGLALQPPGYLINQLGSPPTDPEFLNFWKAGARLIEVYRSIGDVADPDRALGEPPPPRSVELFDYAAVLGDLAGLRATIQPALAAAAPGVEPGVEPGVGPDPESDNAGQHNAGQPEASQPHPIRKELPAPRRNPHHAPPRPGPEQHPDPELEIES